jgi:hypothetical protein
VGDLEVLCARCGGQGGEMIHYDWVECNDCCGGGYVPTALGEQVLALFRHNLRGSTSVLLANHLPPGREQFPTE